MWFSHFVFGIEFCGLDDDKAGRFSERSSAFAPFRLLDFGLYLF